jgi:four helix bundle protein
MEDQNLIELKNLELYQLSRRLSSSDWQIFCRLNFNDTKHFGDQSPGAVDLIRANIEDSYGRYHYHEKEEFYYNSGGSHYESYTDWPELLFESGKISGYEFESINETAQKLQVRLSKL